MGMIAKHSQRVFLFILKQFGVRKAPLIEEALYNWFEFTITGFYCSSKLHSKNQIFCKLNSKCLEYFTKSSANKIDFTGYYSATNLCTPEHFETVYDLLKTKWSSRNVSNINNMFDHCDKYWLSEYHVGWYEGYADGFPSTNNALESTKAAIKDEATLRDRLPLRQFVICKIFIKNGL
ncbi:hypothetical protein BpHYR1_020339 [Brachionus plicatilis]|uniref:Uncharacterized protein n=1 Tax=Brachionus plicatilis TaxID=10195 RepID=A0A3M7RD08_BRAPC|nr:hypothetical protein BpHYR1_020339 [Brachionus plicatilis]